ncbi:hypothetical protein X766_34230 [Mesorhizobium sp. LSJC255A00]|nr:hypothetical protein X766_34230 [Mesorhizobium sp. LSJC255A00]
MAQEMCTCDPPEFDPAMPQPLPQDPRNRRCALERSHGRREGQEQVWAIHLRSSTQDIVGERGAGLLEEGRHPVALALGAPDKDLASSPVDILQLNGAELAVTNTRGGEQQQDGSIADVDRRCCADRIDCAPNVIPCKARRQMRQTPMRRPWDDAGEILVIVASPIQKPKKCSDVRGRRRAGGGGRR